MRTVIADIVSRVEGSEPPDGAETPAGRTPQRKALSLRRARRSAATG
jgi:hypothetical protein